MRYFLDTYALIEIIDENPAYEKYLDFECSTCVFNLYELAFQMLKRNEALAVESFSRFLRFSIRIEDEWLLEAARFKMLHKKKGLSYADCIGYVAAMKSGTVFLTGDKEFKGMPNVEFVK